MSLLNNFIFTMNERLMHTPPHPSRPSFPGTTDSKGDSEMASNSSNRVCLLGFIKDVIFFSDGIHLTPICQKRSQTFRNLHFPRAIPLIALFFPIPGGEDIKHFFAFQGCDGPSDPGLELTACCLE